MAIGSPVAESTGSAPVGDNTDYSDDLSILEADDSSTEEVEEEEKPEEEEPEPEAADSDDSEIEQALEESEETVDEEKDPEDEEDSEFEPGIGRPSFKEITKEFPELAKKFPAIREIYYREAKFTEYFPTVDDAKEAVEKSSQLDILDSELFLKGNPEVVTKHLPDSAIAGFADRFLPALAARSGELYTRVVAPALKRALITAHRDATNAKNENLANACEHLHAFYFNTPDLSAPIPFGDKKPDPEVEKQRKELDERLDQFNSERRQQFNQAVEQTSKTIVLKDLEKTFDPNKTLPDKVRKLLIKDIIDEVDSKITEDKPFMQKIRALHAKASQNGYTKEYKTRMISAYLGAFRALVGPIRQRVKTEALGKSAQPVAASKKRFIPAGKGEQGPVTSAPTRGMSPRAIDWSKTSDIDLLSDKVVLRKGSSTK